MTNGLYEGPEGVTDLGPDRTEAEEMAKYHDLAEAEGHAEEMKEERLGSGDHPIFAKE